MIQICSNLENEIVKNHVSFQTYKNAIENLLKIWFFISDNLEKNKFAKGPSAFDQLHLYDDKSKNVGDNEVKVWSTVTHFCFSV